MIENYSSKDEILALRIADIEDDVIKNSYRRPYCSYEDVEQISLKDALAAL